MLTSYVKKTHMHDDITYMNMIIMGNLDKPEGNIQVQRQYKTHTYDIMLFWVPNFLHVPLHCLLKQVIAHKQQEA